jgi:dynein heavy chain
VIAMTKYDKVAKVVAPKKLAMAEAEARYRKCMDDLELKRAELREVQEKLTKLENVLAVQKQRYKIKVFILNLL